MTDLGDKAKERFLRETKPPEVEGVQIDWSPLPHPAMRDLRGMRFGKLIVKAHAYTREQANGIPCVYWKCQCDCGEETDVSRDHLVRQGTKSCGCLGVCGKKGRDAAQKVMQKRSHYIKRMRHGLPPVPPTEVIGNPAHVFAHDSLMAYACLQWAGYEPAAHHHLIAKYLEKVEKGKIKRLMIFMPPRSGKLCADSTPVMTPNGWTTHGDLKVGDVVYGFDGEQTTIIAISEKHPATLGVHFSNGALIKCHENHEWLVRFFSETEKRTVLSVLETKEIKSGIEKGISYTVPMSPSSLLCDGNEIVGISSCDTEYGHCIQVDNSEGLYRVGNSMIPTHNSMIVSEYFPAWFLGRNPDKRLIATSYGQELASDFGRKVRNQIADPMYSEIFPGVALAGDSAASDKFDLSPPHKGGYFAVGAGGAITGRGANCLLGDTKILTSHGIVDISDILRYNTPLMALSFSEKDAAFIWSPIVAVSRRKTYDLVRVVTDRGSIVCTPEHPFYIEGTGYVEAKTLTKGQGLCVYGMSSLRKGISERPTSNRESDERKGELEFLLFWDMQARSPKGKSKEPQRVSTNESLFNVQKGIQTETGIYGDGEVLLKDMCVSLYWGGDVESADSTGMQILWKRLLCKEQYGHSLFESMCRQNPLRENVWEEQFKLSEWIGDIQRGDEKDDTRDYGERWVAVCSLPRNGESSYPSYRPQSRKQRNGEYGDSLPIMPYAGTQDRRKATVCMVEPVYNGLVEVYDIEVLNTHNFVALNDQGTPLVLKNCLIIDDPIKSREDSDSETSRRKMKDWYTSVAYTRLMDNGAIIICQTRWHTEDLSGWLLKEHKHEKWTVLNLPAINDKGEALWPEKFPLDVLHQIKKTLPARDWQALYQQQPFIEEGGIFKRQWWKLWPDTKPIPDCEFIIQSYDTAYSDKDLKSNSFSARTTWGVFKRADDECHNLILLEAWKARVEYADLRKEAVRAYQDYQPDKVIIEKKASGQALVSDLRRAGLPIATYTPTKDKITRAYIAQSLFENGRVYYPSRQWAEDAITNLCQFPQGADDDLVDTVSMAFIWLQQSFLISHSEDAKRRKQEEELEDDDDLPENVTRLRVKKKKRAVYG